MRKILMGVVILIAFLSVCEGYGAGFLGVTLQPLSQDLRESMGIDTELRGVLISDVVKDSPADECGLKKGDVIVEIDNKPVGRVREVIRLIREHEAGDRVTLKILRDSTPITVEAAVVERKDLDLPKMKRLTRKVREILPVFGGYLGVRVEPISRSLGDYFGVKEKEGVLVVEVIDDTPAEEAGLEPGDVIMEINGKKVSDPKSLRRTISKYEPGDSVEIKYKRKNRTRTVWVELGDTYETFGFDHLRRGANVFGELGPHFRGHPRARIFKYYLDEGDHEAEPFVSEELYDPMVIDEIRDEIEDLREQVEELRKIIEDIRE